MSRCDGSQVDFGSRFCKVVLRDELNPVEQANNATSGSQIDLVAVDSIAFPTFDNPRDRLTLMSDACGPTPNTVLAVALEYAHYGWSVIPIASGTKKPPKGFRWSQFQKRRPSEQELREWLDCRDDLGIAVILGAISGGLVCRDFDCANAYRRWKKAHPDLARTLPTVRTKRGCHVYFRTTVENLVFRDLRPAENGEYRGDSKHYCLLPPSSHPDGSLYEWIVPLPEDNIPIIEDVVAAGIFPALDVTQKEQGSRKNSQVMNRDCSSGNVRRRLSPSQQIVVDEAISRTIPTGPGMRRKKIFDLVRILKFHPEFAGVTASDLKLLIPSLKNWWKQAKPHTSGKHPHFHDTWHDFVFAWEEARIPQGATMHEFWEIARSTPAPGMAIELYGENSLRTQLVSLCWVLQQHAGDKPFPLGGRVVAPLLGVSDVHAWRWLKRLEEDGFIHTEKVHPRGKRLATEWRYIAA